MILTKDQLSQAFPIKTERVKLFETENEVLVRSIPATALGRFRDTKNPDAYIFVNVVVDEAGNRYWRDEDADQVEAQVAAEVIQLVVSKAFALSQVTPERRAEIKKNWTNPSGDGSGE